MTDIIITWPKTKPLEDYLAELAQATIDAKLINFRVGRGLPTDTTIGERCFVSYKGWVRGYNIIVGMGHLDKGIVEDWPAGNYIIRNPEWHPLDKLRVATSFKGFRYVSAGQLDRYLPGATYVPRAGEDESEW